MLIEDKSVLFNRNTEPDELITCKSFVDWIELPTAISLSVPNKHHQLILDAKDVKNKLS